MNTFEQVTTYRTGKGQVTLWILCDEYWIKLGMAIKGTIKASKTKLQCR